MKKSLIEKCILYADVGISRLDPFIYYLNGMSSPKVRRLLNNLGQQCNCYLEIGCWRGSTLISTIHNNSGIKAIGVDDYSQFNDSRLLVNPLTSLEPWAQEYLPRDLPLNEICRLLERYNKRGYILLNGDCFASYTQELISAHLGKNKVDLYFFDGDHEYESQVKALTEMSKFLAPSSIILIDDYNMQSVKDGTRDGLLKSGLKVLESWELPARYNGDIINWWNGLRVMWVEKC